MGLKLLLGPPMTIRFRRSMLFRPAFVKVALVASVVGSPPVVKVAVVASVVGSPPAVVVDQTQM